MATTRIKYDSVRTIKELQQSTDPGRYILNVPGNGGNKPCYMEDPSIRIQKWGGNVLNNHLDIENELLGITELYNRDCLDKTPYKKKNTPHPSTFTKQHYPTCSDLYEDQSRLTEPAWKLRENQQSYWNQPLVINNQKPLLSHYFSTETRSMEKDKYRFNTK
jgi:hypothetical protein